MTDVSTSKTCLTHQHQSVCQALHQPGHWDAVSLTQLIERFEHAQPLVEYRDGEFFFL